jgi:hypothetical protein
MDPPDSEGEAAAQGRSIESFGPHHQIEHVNACSALCAT